MSMMKEKSPSIIYCHGYASSPQSDKVQILRQHFEDVQAFPIDVDPEKSLPYLEEEVDMYLAGSINDERPLVFVGTSLGAWYAGRLAKMFYAPAILINPCYSFGAVKVDLGISEEIKAKYEQLGFEYPEDTRFFLALNDEVIDFSDFPMKHPGTWTQWCPGGHRFNGPEFQQVIDYLKTFK